MACSFASIGQPRDSHQAAAAAAAASTTAAAIQPRAQTASRHGRAVERGQERRLRDVADVEGRHDLAFGRAHQRGVVPQVAAREDRRAEQAEAVLFHREDERLVEPQPVRDLLDREAAGFARRTQQRARRGEPRARAHPGFRSGELATLRVCSESGNSFSSRALNAAAAASSFIATSMLYPSRSMSGVAGAIAR